MVSNDPDFETKAATVIGLQLIPPVQVVVFSKDEEKAIQALGRKDRVLSPGRPESPNFKYECKGRLSLGAALNTATGELLSRTVPRHTTEQFVALLTDVVSSHPERREIQQRCPSLW